MDMSSRLEEDFIGVLPVPKSALYGIQTVRTLQNLSFSERKLQDYPEYIHALVLVKKAAARANFHAGILDATIMHAIEQACDELLAGKYRDQFPIDVLHGGGGIGVNMNVNEVITNLANECLGGRRGEYRPIHPNDQVNASQSTADVCHTAIRIAIYQLGRVFQKTCFELIEVFKQKAEAFQSIPTLSRTCLQDGMKVSFGEVFSGYYSVLKRRVQATRQAIDELLQVNLGGTVIGSGVGALPSYRKQVINELVEVSALPLRLRENLFDAAQNLDDLALVSAQLKLLSSCLIKIAKDIRLLASGPEGGFGELLLPIVQSGSSFFPGKMNPIIAETLIQCGFQVIGQDRVVQATLEHGELDLNIWEGIAGVNIMDSLKMLTRAIQSFRIHCLEGLQVNESRCHQLATSFIPMVVDLKEKYGYSTVSKWLKEMDHDVLKMKYERKEI